MLEPNILHTNASLQNDDAWRNLQNSLACQLQLCVRCYWRVQYVFVVCWQYILFIQHMDYETVLLFVWFEYNRVICTKCSITHLFTCYAGNWLMPDYTWTVACTFMKTSGLSFFMVHISIFALNNEVANSIL
jgi:hypothetical protein